MSARDARLARQRDEARLDELLEQRDLPSVGSTGELSRDRYDRLSQAAHNRRNWVQENVVRKLRKMIRGPQPPERRTRTVEILGHTLEEAVNCVGEALGRVYGPCFRDANVASIAYGACSVDLGVDPNGPRRAASDLHRRQEHPRSGAFSTFADGPCRNRTYNLEIKSLLLCQLS